jgi:hypothetical protein
MLTSCGLAADMRLLAADMRNGTCLLAADMRFQLIIHHPHEFRNVLGIAVTKNILYFYFFILYIYAMSCAQLVRDFVRM